MSKMWKRDYTDHKEKDLFFFFLFLSVTCFRPNSSNSNFFEGLFFLRVTFSRYPRTNKSSRIEIQGWSV